MFELVAMILLAIFTVLMASVGAGEVTKKKSAFEAAGDAVGKAAGGYVAGRTAVGVVKDFLVHGRHSLPKIRERLENYREAKKDPASYVIGSALESYVGKNQIGSNDIDYLDEFVPHSLQESYMNILSAAGYEPKLTHAEEQAKDMILRYAARSGLDTDKIKVRFTKSLGNDTNRAELHSYGDMHKVLIAKDLTYEEMVHAGKHETEHIKDPLAGEPQIEAKLFNTYSHSMKVAQGSYVDELENSGDPQKMKLAEEIKAEAPELKEMLEDEHFRNSIATYRYYKQKQEKRCHAS